MNVPTVKIIEDKASITRVRYALKPGKYEYRGHVYSTGEKYYHKDYNKVQEWVAYQLKGMVVHQHVILTSSQGV